MSKPVTQSNTQLYNKKQKKQKKRPPLLSVLTIKTLQASRKLFFKKTIIQISKDPAVSCCADAVALVWPFKLPPRGYRPRQHRPGVASCTESMSWQGEDGHPCLCHPALGCTAVTLLPAVLERGAGAGDRQAPLRVPAGDSVEDTKPQPFSLLFVFFSDIFQVSHSAPENVQTVQSSRQSSKTWGPVEACRASIALVSPYVMSP